MISFGRAGVGYLELVPETPGRKPVQAVKGFAAPLLRSSKSLSRLLSHTLGYNLRSNSRARDDRGWRKFPRFGRL